MKTITKKDLVDRIAEHSGAKRILVKQIIQQFLDEIINELGQGNRLEFRDFGVFEVRCRAARTAQNPKTMEKVHVPEKRTVKFKLGRLMKERLSASEAGTTTTSQQPAVGEVPPAPPQAASSMSNTIPFPGSGQ